MIISMTGFGRGEAAENGLNATVEIKTLNSRFLDISIRLPQQLQQKELELKELFQKSINRGKLNVNVNKIDNTCYTILSEINLTCEIIFYIKNILVT